MSGTVDIDLINLFFFSVLLVIPVIVLYSWNLLDLGYNAIGSVIRMTVQLLLVGLYLKYLFELNNLWLNLAWLLVMVTVANFSILRGSGLAVMRLFWVTQFSLMLSIISVCLLFLLILVKPVPFMDARYLIPVGGMLLGNVLQGNIRALETFYSQVRANEPRYLSDLLLGATVAEATQPYFRKAVRSSLTPILGSMATLGIVSLPGMMTGQILGGALPLTAAKYQIAIMMAIFLSMICAIGLNLRLSLRVAFDQGGLLKQAIYTRQAE
ncbi:ABC transporter permease [Sansalvadorimonas sp. 2012CJ34-2]|uniref:ABC transporter permease n=1 Tax=Parendozoicomonas callyspongiae TaxID=2942213 RepID=A0ABT0PC11_9GAMM|nr:ABC transporter permease [Sansalvadorimonas sp. 2012CJ34-2]MCL6268791.1 ABC transporter permease [Sansalvadorimonas sp. 2012CJ34-2]